MSSTKQTNQIEQDKQSKMDNNAIILYIMVAGFHHRKGCMIEFCYPPFQNLNSNGDQNNSQLQQNSIELPELWNSLPSLAIPDGAHNFESDTVFFHLPSLDNPKKTVFGVACYQQIMTKMLLVRTPEMTRNSVQKSVIVLLKVPLYGFIERKLRIITVKYFNERDFSKTEILVQFYHSMVVQLKHSFVHNDEIFHGLSLQSLFTKFDDRVLILFKILLLEKKTLFIMSPIKDLSESILALCSLFPGLLQEGMSQSHLSCNTIMNQDCERNEPSFSTSNTKPNINCDTNNTAEIESKENSLNNSTISYEEKNDFDETSDSDEFEHISSEVTNQNMQEILMKPYEYFGLPLELFKCHSYCLPYCSISCFDLLNNERVRSCLAGSSNYIFQRWENDIDVFIVDNKIVIKDQRLKQILEPTLEDICFMSYLIRSINLQLESSGNKDLQCKMDEIDEYEKQQLYEGSDAWIRLCFKNYLLHMLRCSLLDESSKEYHSFNADFMSSWKMSYNYKSWIANKPHIMEIFKNDIVAQHPANFIDDIGFTMTNFISNNINNVPKLILDNVKSTFSTLISTLGLQLKNKDHLIEYNYSDLKIMKEKSKKSKSNRKQLKTKNAKYQLETNKETSSIEEETSL